VEADLESVRFVSIKTAEGIDEGSAIPDNLEQLDWLVGGSLEVDYEHAAGLIADLRPHRCAVPRTAR
jgi:hypothetical protein